MDVSCETQQKLDCYLDLLNKWNPKINLVAPKSLEASWERHFLDSVQVANLCPDFTGHWVDFGSGGGFPGAVIAIAMGFDGESSKMTLVESDLRKATFLKTVSRETSTPFEVLAQRIETVEPIEAHAISARALAPLTKLCHYAHRHMKPEGKAYFLKGQRWEEELAEAQKLWQFHWKAHKSMTNPDSVVLEIGELSHA